VIYDYAILKLKQKVPNYQHLVCLCPDYRALTFSDSSRILLTGYAHSTAERIDGKRAVYLSVAKE
jgi:hypothetical protein